MPLTTEPSYCLIQEHSITVIIKETQTKGFKEFEEEKQTSGKTHQFKKIEGSNK